MRELLSLLFCFFIASLSSQSNLALENLALRQQLAILKRTQKRPVISTVEFKEVTSPTTTVLGHIISLCKDAPELRAKQLPECGRVIEIAEVGGLHHRYERRA